MARAVKLPSSTPNVLLEAQLSDPSGEWTSRPRGLVIVAHPYGFLGGSLSDHVVVTLSRFFLQSGFRVIRFNSRGVGTSQGRGSWSGEVEGADYEAIAKGAVEAFTRDFGNAEGCQLILAGYSAGSMYATFTRAIQKSPFEGPVTYLLVSYPLDKIWALSLFSGRKWKSRLEDLASEGDKRLILIQGTEDQFTKRTSYEQWTAGLEALSTASTDSATSITTVDGADHFWREPSHLSQLLQAIQDAVLVP